MKHCLFILLSILVSAISAQSVQYTHHTSRFDIDDGVMIVPEIAGSTHLWIVTPGKKIKLQIYDPQLEWQQEQLLPFKISVNDDVTILPVKNQYYFYNQTEAGGQGFLWRLKATGNPVDVSSKLRAIIAASFSDSGTQCQLFSNGDNVYIFGNLYYPDLKKVVSTVIKTDGNLEQQSINRYAFDFDHTGEKLQKIIIEPEKNITVLKKRTRWEEGFNLELVKINLQNSQIYQAHFSSNAPFNFPDLVFNSSDSTTVVYSQMTRSYNKETLIRRFFFATLNDTLGEKVKATVLKFSIDAEMPGAFTCINMSNGFNSWVPIHGTWNALYIPTTSSNLLLGLNRLVTLQGRSITVVNAGSFQPRLQPIHPNLQLIFPPGDVKFSVVDERFRNVQDTVIKYHRRNFIEVAQYSSFVKGNQNYLVVKEQFPSKGKGLLLLHLNKQGQLVPLPLRLYERFHYSLPQLQPSGKGKVLIPFINKGEVGLVNMSIEMTE